MQKFNINNKVKVKLTPVGFEIHKNYWFPYCRWGTYRAPVVDEEGYSEFQMHDLMNVFGKYIIMGVKLPFETEILLDMGL